MVDYGCGPGRYLARASRLAGRSGRVYAADISGVALRYASARVARFDLPNVTVLPIREGRSTIPDASADLVYALDMFHAVRDLLRREGFADRVGGIDRGATLEAVLAAAAGDDA